MKIKKVISLILLITFVFSVLWGYQVIKDAKDFTKNMETGSKNLFLLNYNGKIICGFETAPEEKSGPVTLLRENITKIQIDGYQNFSKDYYKIFIFNDKIFQDLPAIINTGNNTNMSRESFISLFDAEDVFAAIVDEKVKAGEIPNTPEAKAYARDSFAKSMPNQDSTALKGMLFGIIIQNAVGNGKNPVAYMFLAIKEGKLTVYPETSFFSAIKMLPSSVIEQIANKTGK